MRFAKRVFKPIIVPVALLGVGVVSVIRIVAIKTGAKYARIKKLDAAKTRLYRLVFNPYRIPNGLRPNCGIPITDPAADIKRCHELIVQARLARNAS